MFAMDLFDFIKKWNLGKSVNINDGADRLHYLVTTVILSVCVTIVTVKQFIFTPISCYVAGRPTGSNFEDYVTNLCWVEGTYAHLNIDHFNRSMLKEEFWDSQEKIMYYQWVPFLLGLQCIFFYLPRFLWLCVVHNRESTDLEGLIENAVEAGRCMNWSQRQEQISALARLFDHMLFLRREIRESHSAVARSFKKCFCRCGKRRGNQICCRYIFFKCLFLVNSVGQLYWMGKYLRTNTEDSPWLYGFQVLRNLLGQVTWSESRIFPRLAFCRIKIRHIGSYNIYLGQCSLPINMLNEKIYICLWVWISIVSVIMLLSIVYWLWQLFCPCLNMTDTVRVLLRMQQLPDSETVNLHKFTQYLRKDGLFLIYMFKLNAGDLVTSDLLQALYKLWLETRIQYIKFMPQPAVTINTCRRGDRSREAIFDVEDSISPSLAMASHM